MEQFWMNWQSSPIGQAEFQLLYSIWELHTPILDKIMVFLSTIGNAGAFWIVASLALLIPKKTRKAGVFSSISIVITFIIGNLILKNAFARPRPCWLDESMLLLVKVPTDFSFPSGHSMNGFTAAVPMLYHNRKIGIPAIVLATAIAFSRLYNFVHFPSDVLIGSILGATIGIVVCLIGDKIIIKKFKEKRGVKDE